MTGAKEQVAAQAKPADHVYYRRDDYAGLFRRLFAMVVDLGALFVIMVAYVIMLDAFGILAFDAEVLPEWFVASMALGSYLYLTALKRSRVRTPGYWVTGLRVIDLRGRPPSMFRMTLRLFWWVLGPVNLVLDLLFMTSDDHRQTLRDKLMGVYVVKRHAQPAGMGRWSMGGMSFMGMMLSYPEVRPIAEAAPGS